MNPPHLGDSHFTAIPLSIPDMKSLRFPLPLAITLIPTFAHAHPGHGAETGGIGWGLAHPFMGLDHMLAMIAVGLWAVQLGKRALWLLPLSFVSAMAVGTALGMSGVRLPLVEPAILASVIGLGALIAFAARVPLGASVAMVAFAALFHGQPHGVEIQLGASALPPAAGLVLSSALLHAIGVAMGLALQRSAHSLAIRVAGASILSAAVLIGFGVI
jgi:urease accessory protein